MYTPIPAVDGVSLTTSDVTYYTSETTSKLIIKSAVFVNDYTSAVTISINVVPYEGTKGYANAIVKDKSVAPGKSLVCSELINVIVGRGEFIVMSASITEKIGCRISGYEVI